jgi:hypothetical protein
MAEREEYGADLMSDREALPQIISILSSVSSLTFLFLF